MKRGHVISVLFVLNGCGGGSSPPPLPPSSTTITYSGFVYASSPATSGVVTAYELRGSAKGNQLSSTSLQPGGSYSISIPAPLTTAVLLEATSLCYEERGYMRDAIGQAMSRQSDFTCPRSGAYAAVLTPTSQTAHLTPFTSAALGFTQYRISQGDDWLQAVNSANNAISILVGSNIFTTQPVVPSLSATGTAGEVYGALCSGIGSWLLNSAMIGAPGPITFGADPYSTLYFAEIMRNDLAFDGLFNGVGAGGASLIIGSQTLNAGVYRHQIAAYAVTRVRGDTATSGTRTNSAQPYVVGLQAYNDRIDALYGGAVIVAFDEGGPFVNILANNGDIVSGDYNLRALVSDIIGLPLNATTIYIDNAYYAQCSPDDCLHFINTTIFPNGPHVIQVRSSNLLGHQSSASVSLIFNN